MTRRANIFAAVLALGMFLPLIFLTIPGTVHAADVVERPYNLLAPLPLSTTTGPRGPDVTTTTASAYIIGIVKLVIAVAGGLAVLRITVSGFQYIATDSFNGKNSAKEGIQEALLGLILVIAAYTILYTINPQLVNFDLRIAGQDLGSALDTHVGSGPDNPPTPTPQGSTRLGIGCDQCVKLNAIVPAKAPGPAGSASAGCLDKLPTETSTSTPVCIVAPQLANKLYTLAKDLKDTEKLDWQVTEMLPPTQAHDSQCHQLGNAKSGQCVDAALRSEHSAANFLKFFAAFTEKVGPSWQYETSSPDSLSTLLRSYAIAHTDVDTNKVDEYLSKIVLIGSAKADKATVEHIHINYP